MWHDTVPSRTPVRARTLRYQPCLSISDKFNGILFSGKKTFSQIPDLNLDIALLSRSGYSELDVRLL